MAPDSTLGQTAFPVPEMGPGGGNLSPVSKVTTLSPEGGLIGSEIFKKFAYFESLKL